MHEFHRIQETFTKSERDRNESQVFRPLHSFCFDYVNFTQQHMINCQLESKYIGLQVHWIWKKEIIITRDFHLNPQYKKWI